jgi:hypothetical protein
VGWGWGKLLSEIKLEAIGAIEAEVKHRYYRKIKREEGGFGIREG